MNWNSLQIGSKISVELVLVISLLTVTFFQFLKLKKEITNVSNSYNDGKQDLELPSMTFCPFGNAKEGNMTFDNYMEHILNVSDFFDVSSQEVHLPGFKYA